MAEFFFGIAGWSYPDWKGIVYPPEQKGRFDELGYVASFFDAIELNNTFYRIPESKIVESWAKRVAHNRRFRFTAKLWKGFTHEKNLEEKEISQFQKALEPLKRAGILGPLLAQFPISFRNDRENRKFLADLADRFEATPLVVEFRNRSWVSQEVQQWLQERQIGLCNVDEPVFRQMIRPSSAVTGPTAYVRFHGRNYQQWFSGNRDSRYDYLYSEEELDEWAPRIREMGKKAKEVYVIGNNHFRGQAPANILQLKSKTASGPVDVPEGLLDAFPQLKKISRSSRKSRQPTLFEDS